MTKLENQSSIDNSRANKSAFERLEPYDGKLSSTVLRGKRSGNASLSTRRSSQEREDKKILNDNQGEKYELFLYDICSNILAYTKGAIYICISSSEFSTLQKAFEEAGDTVFIVNKKITQAAS